jgi:hypothetical protein
MNRQPQVGDTVRLTFPDWFVQRKNLKGMLMKIIEREGHADCYHCRPIDPSGRQLVPIVVPAAIDRDYFRLGVASFEIVENAEE